MFRAYALHTVTGLFLVVLPLLLGLATAIVPLQVGRQHDRLPAGQRRRLLELLVGGRPGRRQLYAVDGGPFGTDVAGVELFLARAWSPCWSSLIVAAIWWSPRCSRSGRPA